MDNIKKEIGKLKWQQTNFPAIKIISKIRNKSYLQNNITTTVITENVTNYPYLNKPCGSSGYKYEMTSKHTYISYEV